MRSLGPLTQERRKQTTVPWGSDPTKPGTEVNSRGVHAREPRVQGRAGSIAYPRASVNWVAQ